MNSRRTVLLCVGAMLLTAAGPSDSTTTKPPLSPDAKSAITNFDRVVKDAKNAYDATVHKARQDAITSLQDVLNKVMAQKNLEEANRIKSVIDNYKALEPPPVEKATDTRSGAYREECRRLTAKLSGTKWQWAEGFRGNAGKMLTLNTDGSALRDKDPLRWVALDGERIAVLNPKGGLDVLNFNDTLTEYRQSTFARAGGGDGWSGKRLADK
jgi:hypothetical protein